jgi:hypothetical protein
VRELVGGRKRRNGMGEFVMDGRRRKRKEMRFVGHVRKQS